MRVRKDKLPANPHKRAALLRDYFCDKDAVLEDSGEDWQLELVWASAPERYVDPRLDEGLRWWGGGISYGDMASARFRQGRVLWALYDTWTLESWSEWLASTPSQEDALTILHIDDHRDLGSPRLFVESGGWRDPITNHMVDLWRPTSVTQAIESGAIGMGSFLTPFLHALPNSDVRHLCQAPKCVGTTDFRFKLNQQPDNLLDAMAVRPSIKLEPSSRGVSPGGYRYTNSLADWLEDISQGPILLHIDLDYFCNRYDGDSDALISPKPLDPSISEIRIQINELGKAINDAGVVDRIADIAIAFSPGFFPAELWEEVSSEVLSAFGEAPCRPPLKKRSTQKPRPSPKPPAGPAKSSLGPVSANMVKLVRSIGTKTRGGGKGGEAWIIQVEEKRAGTVFINLIEDKQRGRHASLQIFLNRTNQGRHIGRAAYQAACLASQYNEIYAHMRKSNTASKKAALYAGFVDATTSSDTQLVMQWTRPHQTTEPERTATKEITPKTEKHSKQQQ